MSTKINISKHLFGAIIGDIAGSCYEFSRRKDYDFEFFPATCDITDDSILTIATAKTLIARGREAQQGDFAYFYRKFANKYPYPKGSYGASFVEWLMKDDTTSYNSLGNGAPMRVSACAYAYLDQDINVALDLATKSAASTHNHWQAVRAVQAVVSCIWYLYNGMSLDFTIKTIDQQFGYDKATFYINHEDLFDAYRNDYQYTEHSDKTVEGALICALTATSFEDAIRRAVSLGGDADTLAAITGSIAEARFEIPDAMIKVAKAKLPSYLHNIVIDFNSRIS